MKRYIIIAIDIILAAYIVFAITAFNNPKPAVSKCTKVNIDIADESTYGFLDAKEIKHILMRKNLYPMGMPLEKVSPREIEEVLSASPFVSTAECCKTTAGHVRITVTQRSPIVRVKSSNGDDYYIDENGGIMPNSKYNSDLIIVTGNVTRAFAQQYVSILTKVIMASDLWRNQIEQINVMEDNGIELVPRVGDHIVFLGYLPACNDESQRKEEVCRFVTEKLSRLEKFYTYGLSVAGWNKYERIDIQYSNQIICKRHSSLQKAETKPIEREQPVVTEEQKKQEEGNVVEKEKKETPQENKKEPAKKEPAKKEPAKKEPAKKKSVKNSSSKKDSAKKP